MLRIASEMLSGEKEWTHYCHLLKFKNDSNWKTIVIKDSDEVFVIEKYLQLKNICNWKIFGIQMGDALPILALQCIECPCDGLLGTCNGIWLVWLIE